MGSFPRTAKAVDVIVGCIFFDAESDECSWQRAEMTIAQAKHKLRKMAALQDAQLEPSDTFFYVDQTDKATMPLLAGALFRADVTIF